jgi:hypothetical protein
MTVPSVGTIDGITLHAQTAPNGYVVPQVVPMEINNPGMLGDLVMWGAYKSGETQLITKTLCESYAAAIAVQELAASYSGYTCDLSLLAVDASNKEYYAVVMGVQTAPLATNLDDETYQYIVQIAWRLKLYPKAAV